MTAAVATNLGTTISAGKQAGLSQSPAAANPFGELWSANFRSALRGNAGAEGAWAAQDSRSGQQASDNLPGEVSRGTNNIGQLEGDATHSANLSSPLENSGSAKTYLSDASAAETSSKALANAAVTQPNVSIEGDTTQVVVPMQVQAQSIRASLNAASDATAQASEPSTIETGVTGTAATARRVRTQATEARQLNRKTSAQKANTSVQAIATASAASGWMAPVPPADRAIPPTNSGDPQSSIPAVVSEAHPDWTLAEPPGFAQAAAGDGFTPPAKAGAAGQIEEASSGAGSTANTSREAPSQTGAVQSAVQSAVQNKETHLPMSSALPSAPDAAGPPAASGADAVWNQRSAASAQGIVATGPAGHSGGSSPQTGTATSTSTVTGAPQSTGTPQSSSIPAQNNPVAAQGIAISSSTGIASAQASHASQTGSSDRLAGASAFRPQQVTHSTTQATAAATAPHAAVDLHSAASMLPGSIPAITAPVHPAAAADPMRTGAPSSAASASGNPFAALDQGSTVGTPTWTHAAAQHAEAGFHDPSLGWVGVRADLDPNGVHATLLPGSADAAQVLGSHVTGLVTHLAEQHASVASLSLASSGSGTSSGGGMGQSMHSGANGNPQPGTASYAPQASAQPGAPIETRSPVESIDAESGLRPPQAYPGGLRGTHISVVA